MGRITDALKRAMLYKNQDLAKSIDANAQILSNKSFEKRADEDYKSVNFDKMRVDAFAYYGVGGVLLDEFQHIRAALMKKNYSSVLITSSLPEDGKTTVAVNMGFAVAKAFSSEGKRVLLIDSDFHKRPFYDIFGVDMYSYPGMLDAIGNRSDIRDLIVRDKETGLFVLFTGTKNMDTMSVVGIKNLLSVLRSEFDFVIMDSMPVLNFVEPRELAPFFDAVLYVVKLLKTPRGSISYGVQCLRDMGQNNMLFVINGVKAFLPTKKTNYYKK